jgi:hypothetical protein
MTSLRPAPAIALLTVLAGPGWAAEEECALLLDLQATSVSMLRTVREGGLEALGAQGRRFRRALDSGLADLGGEVLGGRVLSSEDELFLTMLISHHRSLLAEGGGVAARIPARSVIGTLVAGQERLAALRSGLDCTDDDRGEGEGPASDDASRQGQGGDDGDTEPSSALGEPDGPREVSDGGPRAMGLGSSLGGGTRVSPVTEHGHLRWLALGVAMLVLTAPFLLGRLAGAAMPAWIAPRRPGTRDMRTAPRVVCDIEAILEADGRREDTRVVNLSPDGCGLFASEALRRGDRLVVHAGALAMPGEVRWRSVTTAGVKFDRTLEDDELASLLA